ncbi:uncharacterized protein HD556DRAFT_361235 [Suillus plorans]|uniref:Uncharacterized protein n=1 Tax=Suillus plorans TaxID=116603 RepID=A0A9P7DJQ8_9AGAM|nr:uncharacterized protein HD556DRAFT_361235 [Suillus plorans]KAG1796059.1 hypothetical protein HD556DRAFT_361235 [Suillus plorans]
MQEVIKSWQRMGICYLRKMRCYRLLLSTSIVFHLRIWFTTSPDLSWGKAMKAVNWICPLVLCWRPGPIGSLLGFNGPWFYHLGLVLVSYIYAHACTLRNFRSLFNNWCFQTSLNTFCSFDDLARD